MYCADAKMTEILSSLGQILPSSPRPKSSRSGGPLRSSYLGHSSRWSTAFCRNAKIAWRNVWVGAGVRALLFLRGNHLIGWCLAATSISLIYGAVGSIVIVLRWVYYSSQVAVRREFTRVYTKHRGSPLEPQENAMRINRKEYA